MHASAKQLVFCVLLCCVFTLAAGSIRVTRQNVDIDFRNNAIRTLRIALISDLHLTKDNLKKTPFPELPACLEKESPDLILIAGDIFHAGSNPEGFAEEFRTWIRKFPVPKNGIFAVLGNHDLCNGDKMTMNLLKSAGIVPLCNSGVQIRIKDAPLSLLGTEESWDESKYLANSFRKVIESAAPCILLAHRPVAFPPISADSPVLVLAGHTHGGVVHLPGLPRGTLMKLFRKEKYVYGWFEKGKKRLFVTAGLGGEDNSNYRFNNPPEVVILTFRQE